MEVSGIDHPPVIQRSSSSSSTSRTSRPATGVGGDAASSTSTSRTDASVRDAQRIAIIHDDLKRLREQREQLERQRQALLASFEPQRAGEQTAPVPPPGYERTGSSRDGETSRVSHSNRYAHRAWIPEEDSMCQMGFFLTNPPRGPIFGTEARFRPLAGRRGKYYYVGGCQTHSNDAPGPGAYTPLYSKASKPSPLAFR